MDHTLTFAVTVAQPAKESFDVVLSELTDALARLGIQAEFRPAGKVMQGEADIGAVSVWKLGEAVHLTLRGNPWEKETPVEVRIRFEPEDSGTRITWIVRGWDRVLANPGAELSGWVASSLLAPALEALTPAHFGDWLTDRRARRPSGKEARATYRDPLYHWPNFLLILDRIALKPSDRLLDVGCGGGAFLRRALESRCTAVGVDHSPDMVREANEVNREAVGAGRLRIVEAEAELLPVPDGEFTCAVMTGVFGFLPDPVAALREIHRALKPGGRIAVFAGTAALRGTPAAPEPLASRVRFYEDAELGEFARRAGFTEVRVEQPNMDVYTRAAGLPADVQEFFRTVGGAQLLLAKRAPSGSTG